MPKIAAPLISATSLADTPDDEVELAPAVPVPLVEAVCDALPASCVSFRDVIACRVTRADLYRRHCIR